MISNMRRSEVRRKGTPSPVEAYGVARGLSPTPVAVGALIAIPPTVSAVPLPPGGKVVVWDPMISLPDGPRDITVPLTVIGVPPGVIV